MSSKNKYIRLKDIPINNGIELFKSIKENGANLFGGMGEMGSKAYSTLLRAGIPTSIQDVNPMGTRKSQLATLNTLEKGVKRKKVSEEQLKIIKEKKLVRDAIVFPNGGNISFKDINEAHKQSYSQAKELVNNFLNETLGKDTNNRNDYSNVMFVIEAGPENLNFKQGVFEFFELALNSTKAILATNTSSLKVSEIASRLENPERAIGYHYFLPAHINPLIEIIVPEKTKEEVVHAMLHLACAMHKKPIICRGDSPGAIANRILVGVLNEAAKIYDEGHGSIELIDEVFLETFYSKQIKVKTKKAQNQFKAAPKLSYFNDEIELYEKISVCDIRLQSNPENEEKVLANKNKYLEEVEGKLRQKILYSSIVENHERLGVFFKPSPCVVGLKERANNQLQVLKTYLNEVKENWEKLKEPFIVIPFKMPDPNIKSSVYKSKQYISERLSGAYLAIAFKIFNEGLSDIQDIEIACKEGFKWNVGPFEMSSIFGFKKSKELVKMINENYIGETGISSEHDLFEISELDLSGIRTYILNNIGYIEIGKIHIQHFQHMQNSLSPKTIKAIKLALKELEENPDVKSIFFKGQGGGPFSAGADLNYFEETKWDMEKAIEYINLGDSLMDEIEKCKKTTVAIIDGPAIGGGAELALACDYRIMTDLSYVAFPEVALGIIPRWGGTQRLPALIGKKLASAMITTATLDKQGFKLGIRLSGSEAFSIGFADGYVIQSELPFFIADLIQNKNEKINIYKKPDKKSNFEKNDYPESIVKKFKLKSPKKIKRFFTKYAFELAFSQIENSHDASFKNKSNNDKKLMSSGKTVLNIYVNPILWAIQNSDIAKLLELLKIA